MSLPDLTPSQYRQCRKDRETQARVISDLQEQNAELQRREALMTEGFLSAVGFLEAQKVSEEQGSDEDWIEEVDVPLVASVKRFMAAHSALTAAGFDGSGWQDGCGE